MARKSKPGLLRRALGVVFGGRGKSSNKIAGSGKGGYPKGKSMREAGERHKE